MSQAFRCPFVNCNDIFMSPAGLQQHHRKKHECELPGSVEACAFVPAKAATWVTAAKPIALAVPVEFKRQRIGGDVLVSLRRDDSDDSSSSSSSSSSEDEAPPPPKRSPPPAKPTAPAPRTAVPSKASAKRDEDLVPPWARAKATATATATATSPTFTPAVASTLSVADTTASATKKRKDSTSSSVLPPPPAPAASFALPGLPAAAKRTPVPMAAPNPLQVAAATAQLPSAQAPAPAPATAEAKTIRCPLATCPMTFATEKAAKQHHAFKHKTVRAAAAAPVVHAQGSALSLPVAPPLAPPAPAMQFASLSAAMSRFNATPAATPLGFPTPPSVAKMYPLPVFPAPKPMAVAATAFAPLGSAWPNTHASGPAVLAESDDDTSSDADDEADVVPHHAGQPMPTGGVARAAASAPTATGGHLMQESDEDDDDDVDDEDELANMTGYAQVSLPAAARATVAAVVPAAISAASSGIASGNAVSLATALPAEFQEPFMSQVESLQQQFQQQFDQQVTALSTYYQQLAAKTPKAKKTKTPTPAALPLAAPLASSPAVSMPLPAAPIPTAPVARLMPFAPLPMSSTLPFAPVAASTATAKPFTPLPLPSGFTPASLVPPNPFSQSSPAQSKLLSPTPASTPDTSGAADCLRLDVGKSQLKLAQSLAAPLALIDKPQQIAAAVRDLAKRNVMSVDCEGINMDRRGKLCLVSIATSQKRYLFDIVTLGTTVFDQGLRAILENPQIVKLFFDSRRDSDALFHQFQILDLALRKQSSLNSKYRAGLSTCLETYLPQLAEQYNFKAIKQATVKRFAPEQGGDPNLWEKRPLDVNLLQYATFDVVFLRTLCATIQQRLTAPYNVHAWTFSAQNVASIRDLADHQITAENSSAKAPAGF